MSTLSPSLEAYRIAQQERYALQGERYLASLSKNKLTPRQTQLLMNKYPFAKAMQIAKRYNQMKGVK